MIDALSLEAQPGIDEGTLAALRSARAVALARYHTSPVDLELDDSGGRSRLALTFEQPGPRAVSSWADRDRTTEWAAEAIALEAIFAARGVGAIHRAARGTRFDWYVGAPGTDLETATALEIGGTDRRRTQVILAEKVRQIRKRATGRPGLAVAVQIRTPHAMLEDA